MEIATFPYEHQVAEKHAPIYYVTFKFKKFRRCRGLDYIQIEFYGVCGSICCIKFDEGHSSLITFTSSCRKNEKYPLQSNDKGEQWQQM